MNLLVYMRDGRTVYAIPGRGRLRGLLGTDPANENPAVDAIRGVWNPTSGEYVWSRGIRLRFLSKNSVSVVEEATPNDVRPPVEPAE